MSVDTEKPPSAPSARPAWWVTLAVTATFMLPVGLLIIGVGYHQREAARERWSEVSTHVGEPGYDAAESDRRYLEVEEWNEWVDVGLRATGAGVVGLALVMFARRRNA